LTTSPRPSIAVILPCHNEAVAVGDTIAGFREALPGARIVVCDNASSDDTSARARAAGAEVIRQELRGKGNAVRRLFSEVEADIYVMADGDSTYDAASAAPLAEALVAGRLDMVIGLRQGQAAGQYRFGHFVGNRFYSWLFSRLFGVAVKDLFSGYRVMSRRFVKTFPCYSRGFEIETELNTHAAIHKLPIAELPTPYFARPEGSASKLNKVRDGFRILTFFAVFMRDYAPMRMFGALALLLALASIVLFVPVGLEFLRTGLVPRLPTFASSLTLFALAVVSFFGGFAMQSIAAARQQNFMIAYQALGSTNPIVTPASNERA
jgi:glycosyltransferase involved in cell wall biosynthesis